MASCEIHMTSTIHTRVFAVVESTVCGMVNFALALSNGAAMSRFRFCVKQVVEERLVLIRGTPPAGAQQHKRRVLAAFGQRGADIEARRLMLLAFANGDWRNETHIEHDLVPGGDGAEQEESVRCVIRVGLCNALCPARPRLYPRHRWTHADAVVDELGLLQTCSGILQHAFKKFVEMTDGCMVGRLASGGDAPQDAVLPANPGEMSIVSRDTCPAPPLEAETWAEANARDRQRAVNWFQSSPPNLGQLLLLRSAMEPLRVLMKRQLEMAAEEWEVEEQSKVARAVWQGLPAEGVRRYRVQVAADHSLEQEAFRQLALLFQEEQLWLSQPAECWVLRWRALAFSVMSHIGCAIEHYFVERHRQFPFRLFKILERPEAVQAIRAEAGQCPMMLDSWTAAVLADDPALNSEATQCKLQLAAVLAWTDIAGVEARHAAMRRRLVSRSCQCPTRSLEVLSAEHML